MYRGDFVSLCYVRASFFCLSPSVKEEKSWGRAHPPLQKDRAAPGGDTVGDGPSTCLSGQGASVGPLVSMQVCSFIIRRTTPHPHNTTHADLRWSAKSEPTESVTHVCRQDGDRDRKSEERKKKQLQPVLWRSNTDEKKADSFDSTSTGDEFRLHDGASKLAAQSGESGGR